MGEILKFETISVITSCHLDLSLDPDEICSQLSAIEKNKSMRNLIWRHKSIKGTALLFFNGYISVHGCKSIQTARKSLRQFARILQRLGYNPKISRKIKINTMSAKFHINNRIDLARMSQQYRCVQYEPEIFSAAIFESDGMKFLIYSSGAVIISGIKNKPNFVSCVFKCMTNIKEMSLSL